MSNHKSGFVTLVGKPNVGKSTLINNILQEKVTIVTNKPQTTRNQIRGIYNDKDFQIVFLDNPGIHKSTRQLSKHMNRLSLKSTKGVDVIMFLVDSRSGIREEDQFIIKQLQETKDTSLIIGLSKVDLIKKEKLIPLIQKLSNDLPWYNDIIPINSTKEKDGKLILNIMKKFMPEHPAFYSKDESSDRSNKFIISEIIREKALNNLYQEVPHSIHVEIAKLEDNTKKNVIKVMANIIIERDSQKKVVIGKSGSMLKKIGTAARLELEKSYEAKVFLELFVKVKDKWRDDKQFIDEYEVVK